MATPNYAGSVQQPSSISSWLGSWLGVTPAYAGTGQPVTKASMFGTATPAYKTVQDNAPAPDDGQCGPFAIVIPRPQ